MNQANGWPERIYAFLLLAYPVCFRRQFSSEMVQVFRTRRQRGPGTRRFPSAAVFWKGIMLDWMVSAARERVSSVSPGAAAVCFAALCLGVFAAYVDFGNDEVQAPVLAVLAGCFVLGLIQPHAAWRWPLLVALWLPIARWVAPHFGLYPKLPATPNNFATLIALIPAFIGAYAGVMLRMFGRLLLQ